MNEDLKARAVKVCQDLRNGSTTVETIRTQKEDRCEPNEYRGVSLHVSEAQHGPFAGRSEEGAQSAWMGL